ncbi:MAG: hypothetical protein IJA89_04755 [Clostridia bacterium]|nr:hypothetical protein [Clostridia bacterium]
MQTEKMDISKIDVNFAKTDVTETDITWRKATDSAFDLRGVFYDEAAGCYYRMKREIADQVSAGVQVLARCTVGGRIRFRTNSPYITARVKSVKLNMSWNYSLFARCGLCVYVNGVYDGFFRAGFKQWENAKDDIMRYDGIYYTREKGVYDVEIYMPNYSEKIYDVEIGLKDGCEIYPAKPYTYNDKPVVFYGTSMTQGACVSRAGNDYISLLCRWCDTDFINLGFSGNGKGEPIMADYLADLDPSIFVLDYDGNVRSVEDLEKSHMPMYRKIRAKHPTTPIVLITMPALDSNTHMFVQEKKELIYKNYLTMKAEGDNNVYFVDGKTLLGDEDVEAGFTDLLHPNDLGYYRIAKSLQPLFTEILKTTK